MNILAIDYGTKRIGLAWSDTTFGAVLPYGLIEQESKAGKIKELGKLINSEKIDLLVVGFPTSLNGAENKNTERIKGFIFELQKNISIPIEYYDERFSSQAADAMGEGGASRDEKSAMVILEGYLQSKKRKK